MIKLPLHPLDRIPQVTGISYQSHKRKSIAIKKRRECDEFEIPGSFTSSRVHAIG